MSKYINADELKEHLKEYRPTAGQKDDYCDGKNYMWSVAKNLINKMPSADVRENIHGEWKLKAETFTNLNGETEYAIHGICSVCNQRQSYGNYPFCPWCGADMRGEQNETKA